MSYRVQFEPAALKFLRKLRDEKLRQRIIQDIETLQDNPRPVGGSKLTGLPYWRIRIGDCRVVYRIEDDVLLVLVIEIGHHREIYR